LRGFPLVYSLSGGGGGGGGVIQLKCSFAIHYIDQKVHNNVPNGIKKSFDT